MAINKKLLLYMEPQETPSKEPIIDDLTRKMTAYYNFATKGVYPYSKDDEEFDISKFRANDFYMGYHSCSCGVQGGDQVFLIANKMVTNELCVHYLAYHRKEVSKKDIDWINKNLPNLFCEPTEQHLKTPLPPKPPKKELSYEEMLDIDKKRKEYLKNNQFKGVVRRK